MHTVSIATVVIGDELLLGHVADTNSSFIARSVEPLSWTVTGTEIVGDSEADITSAVRRALDRAQVTITTGGLGPTRDDITKRALCSVFGGQLRHDPAVLANVERVMAERHRPINDLTRQQAIVPDSATVIQNSVGTAPLLWFERPADGHILVAMPGVPFEAEHMLTTEVLPRLRARLSPDVAVAHRSLVITGMSESALAELIEPVESALPAGVHIAYLPQPGYIHLRIDGSGTDADTLTATLASSASAIEALLPEGALIARADLTPAEILLGRLTAAGLTVATAESCTGGCIAHRITSVPGSSAAMLGGVVAYCNDVKRRLLGVSADTLAAYGAVSEPTVAEMALGACRATGASVGIATSGIAGPGGAEPGKPVGTVWIAVSRPDGSVLTRCVHLPGSRSRVITHATNLALLLAISTLPLVTQKS